jgi:hypothetical protein
LVDGDVVDGDVVDLDAALDEEFSYRHRPATFT